MKPHWQWTNAPFTAPTESKPANSIRHRMTRSSLQAHPLRNVSDTAHWVAIYRAMESERPDALFNDPLARRLGGERGEAIVKALPRGPAMGWAMTVRTVLLDEMVMRCIRNGVVTVLNLAAGLDARPFRLNLPSSLRWLHVDMPDMIDYFRDHTHTETPHCTLELIATDLRDGEARKQLFAHAASFGPVVVISEGLLIYLSPEQVAELAHDLHAMTCAKWWLFDLASPRLLKYTRKRWKQILLAGHAPFLFAPPEGTDFFLPHGWREAEFHSTWDTSWRLQRTMSGAWLWNLLSRLQSPARREVTRRMSGCVMLENAVDSFPTASRVTP